MLGMCTGNSLSYIGENRAMLLRRMGLTARAPPPPVSCTAYLPRRAGPVVREFESYC